MMSSDKQLKKTFEKVRILSLATPKARKQLIQNADRETVNCVSECCMNVLKGNVPLTPKEKARLSKHRSHLHTVARKSTSLRDKKTIIQKGGFLGALLAPIVSLLGGLLLR